MPVLTRRLLDILPDPHSYADVDEMIDLSTNEPRLHPPQAVVDALRESAALVNQYPQTGAARLTSRLASYHHIDPLRFVVGNGSMNVLQQLILAVCEPYTSVVYGAPGFVEYHDQTRVVGARTIPVPLTDGRHDVDAMLAAIDRGHTRMVILANPHNPTGSLLTVAELERFLDRIPEDVLLVVDEAYLHFADDPDAASAIALGEQEGWGNLAVLRTLSKGFALGGARIGYAITGLHVAAAARKCGRPYSVNRFAEIAAQAALEVANEYSDAWAAVRHEREHVREQLLDLGFAVPRSHGNFLWLPLGMLAPLFHEHCLNNKIRTRNCAEHGVRVTVGTPEENDAFIAAARTFPLTSFESLHEGTPGC